MKHLATIAIALGVGILAWTLRAQLDRSETVTKVEYRDRVLTVRDTIRSTVPDVRIIYKTQTDTFNVCETDTASFPLPVDLDFGGVVSTRPVKVKGQGVTLSVWHPYGLRWVQYKYKIKPARMAFWLDAGSAISPAGFSVGGRANARIGRMYVNAGYQFGPDDHQGFAAAVHYRLLGRNY
jgi:hypothetical protein